MRFLDRVQLARAEEEVSHVHDVKEPREKIRIRTPAATRTCGWTEAPCSVALGEQNVTGLCRLHYFARRAMARKRKPGFATTVSDRAVKSLEKKRLWHMEQAERIGKILAVLVP